VHLRLFSLLFLGLGLKPLAAFADESKPAPYSLPFQLRPSSAVNVIRSDTSTAFYKVSGERGSTTASLLLGSYKLTPDLAPFMRLGMVVDSPPSGATAAAFVNPLVGVTYARKPHPTIHAASVFLVAVPIGMGGGNQPSANARAAQSAGILARSAMDNAMFAVNDLTFVIGGDVAYVNRGITVQAEATVLELIRVRGKAVQPDSAKTNFTGGIHLGYFLASWMSLGTELRYQRWLSTPSFVGNDSTGTLRDTLSLAAGARVHISLGQGRWLRPAASYTRGLDDPMAARHYHIVQIDLPFVF
jgi:hypothetical protein